MKKIFIILFLLICAPVFAMTVTTGNDYVTYTASAINTTTSGNVTDTFPLGSFEDVSFQCVWASVTGTQPQYKLQTSNNAVNWDDVTGALTITTSSSGSDTWILDSLPVKQARINVSTASTTGTLDCTAVAQGR